jgi:hypothetical protein
MIHARVGVERNIKNVVGNLSLTECILLRRHDE